MNLEGGDAREEILREIKELEREKTILRTAVEEGDIVSDNLNGRFWEILKRTLSFLKQAYIEEACHAAQDVNKSPGFFMGRVANVDDFMNTIEVNFVQGKEKATQRIESINTRIKDLHNILDGKSGQSYTGGTGEV